MKPKLLVLIWAVCFVAAAYFGFSSFDSRPVDDAVASDGIEDPVAASNDRTMETPDAEAKLAALEAKARNLRDQIAETERKLTANGRASVSRRAAKAVKEHQLELEKLIRELSLDSAQADALQTFVQARLDAAIQLDEAHAAVRAGELTPAEYRARLGEHSDIQREYGNEAFAKVYLDDSQKEAFEKLTEAERAREKEALAYTRLANTMNAVQLTEEQKDAVFEAYLSGATQLNGDDIAKFREAGELPADDFERMQYLQRAAIQKELSVMKRLLTPDQYAAYEKNLRELAAVPPEEKELIRAIVSDDP